MQWKIFVFNFYSAHTFFSVFFNSKNNLFSYIFWFKASFLCKNAIEKNGPCWWENDVKICRIEKITKNHFSRSYFGSWGGSLGVLGASLYWKVVSEFWFGSPKCHFRYAQNGKNSRISLHIHNVINHSGNLSTWQDTWSLILERSHTIVRNAVNHSPMWKDTCKLILRKRHTIVYNVANHSIKLEIWKFDCSPILV